MSLFECNRVGAALAALFFCVAGFAQESSPKDRHLYAGGGVGQGHWRPGCPGSVLDCDDTNVSVHVFGGYKLNSIFAGEVAFTNYGKASGTNMEVKGRGWEASAIAAWPVHGPLSVFGRLGRPTSPRTSACGSNGRPSLAWAAARSRAAM